MGLQAKQTNTPSGKKKQKFVFINGVEETDDDLYIKSTIDTTLDSLALQYYRDESKWRIIALANNLKTIFPPDGMILRIPINPKIRFEID